MPPTPTAELDARYSDDNATATSWEHARSLFAEAEVYWLTTIRSDGRPHATPLLSVTVDGAPYVCTGPDEQKARNIEGNPHCLLLTGCNRLGEGFDIVVEGEAVRVSDDARLQRVAAAFEEKYGSDWHFDVHDGMFHHGPGEAIVFEIVPDTAYGFGKGESFSHTRWQFAGS